MSRFRRTPLFAGLAVLVAPLVIGCSTHGYIHALDVPPERAARLTVIRPTWHFQGSGQTWVVSVDGDMDALVAELKATQQERRQAEARVADLEGYERDLRDQQEQVERLRRVWGG